MDIMIRGFRFLKRYLFKNPRYTVKYLMVFWRKEFNFSTRLLNEGELIEKIKNGKSLIRLGDGEVNLMLGLKNHYQNFSPVLKRGMFDIVRDYTKDSSYILSIPRFINCTNDELRMMGKFQVWLPLKVMFDLYFKHNLPYLDAHSFYYDQYFERTVGKVIAHKKVILITNIETIEKQRINKNIPWSTFKFIQVPSEDSLHLYEIIKTDIEKAMIGEKKEEIVLLFAMGPVGKLLTYEYANAGIQSIDIGKVAEVMYTGESIAYIV